MKKVLILLPVILAGFFILTGQSYQNDPRKWNQDPRMTKFIPTGEYASLPQDNNLKFSTESRILRTPEEDILISPNFRVHPSEGSQSETPITRHPANPLIMLASANTWRGGSAFSTGVYVTTNGGINWFGSDTLNNGSFNYGDPGPAIDKDGRFYMSYITLPGNLGASYSTDMGITWAPTVTFPGSTTSSDKNFTATDESPGSPYYGRAYTVYTEFGGVYNNRVVISYSTNGGVNWSNIAPVDDIPSFMHFHQGADVKVGSSGDVNVVWANNISNGQNSTEDSLGFARSTDGGVSWVISKSNAYNMNGIRTENLFNGIRSNGFPRIDIDKTGGSRNGWIYAVTSEKFVAPATDDADVILHRSTDGGVTWNGVRVNQDPPGTGKFQYVSAVRVDEQGAVNVIYYDTRNTPTNDSAQIYISRSINGGDNWTDILVSDHKFKPKVVTGLASGYQGDYIGITSNNNILWPYWCEDITSVYQAWTASVNTSTYPLSTFNLTSPSAGSRLVSYPNSYIPTTFNWDTSSTTGTYKWVFGSPTVSPRKITFPVVPNSLTVLSGQMDSILASLGVAVGDSLVGQWDVWAFKNAVINDSLKASNGPRAITLKRGVPPLTSFNLISPASGTRIETSAFDQSNVNFNWRTSGPGVSYKWKFGSPTISLIRLTLTSNISGIDSSVSVPNYTLDNMLSSIGLIPGDSITGEWSAWAYNGFDSVKASQNYAITMKRQIKGDVLVLYDSTNTNCRISRDSVVRNLAALGLTSETYNRKGVTATNSISFKGFRSVLLLGEGSSTMSNVIKDSIKAYLGNGTSINKSKLIIMGEDIGYQLDRSTSIYYDSAFCRGMCGFQYVADRPGPVPQRGLVGITININTADSSNGPSMDVIKRSLSVPEAQTFNLYKYRLFTDSMNAIGRLSPTYNVATFCFDVESLRPAFDSPNTFTVKRMLQGALNFVGIVTSTGEENNVSSIPETFSLSQNYPNPFNPTTNLEFGISNLGFVSLKVYDILGKEVKTLVNETKPAGIYKIEFDGSSLSSGVYYYRLVSGSFTDVKRMVLLK
jgi:hypothetical protein